MARATIVEANGVDLCVEDRGDPTDPPVLLVAGASSSMDWWEDDFCDLLLEGGRRVVRYDHRDTGRSVSYRPGAPGYGFGDLVDDAAGVLDALGIAHAHVAGISMGGAIAQAMALDHRGRVASLTLIATSPAGPDEPDLPPMDADLRAAYARSEAPDWSDREAALEHLTTAARIQAARSRPFDEAGTRTLCERVLDRTTNIAASMANHTVMDGGERRRERLGAIDVPTLVVHGAEDPLFPRGHGVALAREIAGAELLVLEHTGHELPRRMWGLVVPRMLELSQNPSRQTSL
jgi:pimeloyl-ACP methyl ester carboxylesterase